MKNASAIDSEDDARAGARNAAAANSAIPSPAGLDADLELGLGERDLLARAASRCRGWRRRRADRWSGRRGWAALGHSPGRPYRSRRRGRRPAPRRGRRPLLGLADPAVDPVPQRAARPRPAPPPAASRRGRRPRRASCCRERPKASSPISSETVKPTPASIDSPTHVDPREVVVELRVGERVQQPGRAGDADGLADDQAEHHAERHRVAQGVPSGRRAHRRPPRRRRTRTPARRWPPRPGGPGARASRRGRAGRCGRRDGAPAR